MFPRTIDQTSTRWNDAMAQLAASGPKRLASERYVDLMANTCRLGESPQIRLTVGCTICTSGKAITFNYRRWLDRGRGKRQTGHFCDDQRLVGS